MAATYETLTPDGLIYTLMMQIGQQEGKFDNLRWKGDRAYVLDLAREVIGAVRGGVPIPDDFSQLSDDELEAEIRRLNALRTAAAAARRAP